MIFLSEDILSAVMLFESCFKYALISGCRIGSMQTQPSKKTVWSRKNRRKTRFSLFMENDLCDVDYQQLTYNS